MRALLNTIVPLYGFPSAGADTGEGSSSPRSLFTSEEKAGEGGTLGSLVPSQACSHSVLPIATPSHEGRPVTVHEFLQDMTSKSGRKYGRRNRLGTVKLDVGRSEDCSPIPAPSRCPAEHRSDSRISGSCGIPPKHDTSRLVPHLRRRKKHFAKPLAQRLFEADIFSSGTSSRPTDTPQDLAHIPTRQPLQFVTSSNLTPSLKSCRIRERRQVDGARQGTVTPAQMLAASIAPVTSPYAASGEPSSINGAVTTQRARPLAGSSGAVLASRRKVFRAHGGKQSLARSPPGPFQYAPLPLVQVKIRQGAMLS
jgi:hypothetical protein